MSDDLRCRGLFANLTARLRCASFAELQLIDRALETLEGVRERDAYGRRWERRIATGPGDVDRSWHLALRGSEYVRTACKGSWLADDATEQADSPPLKDRCRACWREAVRLDPVGLALIDELDEVTGTCTGLTARWCSRCGDCKCPQDGDLNDPGCPLHAVNSRHAVVDDRLEAG